MVFKPLGGNKVRNSTLSNEYANIVRSLKIQPHVSMIRNSELPDVPYGYVSIQWTDDGGVSKSHRGS